MTHVIAETEDMIRGVAAELLGPWPRECLYCYVARMLGPYPCDTNLRFALHYRDQVAPRATALEHRLGEMGAFCDCEIFLNAVDLTPRWSQVVEDAAGWEPGTYGGLALVPEPDPEEVDPPPCLGVRRGSTQWCGRWERQRRRPPWG